MNKRKVKVIDDCVKNYIECYRRADTEETRQVVDEHFEQFIEEIDLYKGQKLYLIDFYKTKTR